MPGGFPFPVSRLRCSEMSDIHSNRFDDSIIAIDVAIEVSLIDT